MKSSGRNAKGCREASLTGTLDREGPESAPRYSAFARAPAHERGTPRSAVAAGASSAPGSRGGARRHAGGGGSCFQAASPSFGSGGTGCTDGTGREETQPASGRESRHPRVLFETAERLPATDGARLEGKGEGATSRPSEASESGHRSPDALVLRRLFHLDYGDAEAELRWSAIDGHRSELSMRLGRDPGALVAGLDYLLNVRGELREPTVLERSDLETWMRQGTTDALTNLLNRREFDAVLDREVQRASRGRLNFSLLFIDLDRFKSVNDRYGHQAGDDLLVAVSETIGRGLRGIDYAFRIGGDEFALILPGTERQGARIVAERIRRDVRKGLYRCPGVSRVVSTTLSGGLAVFPDDARAPDELVRKADEALYRMKREGRDRIL